MFDDLRREADSTPYEEEQYRPRPRQAPEFLGMTAGQRLIIAVMLLLVTCILSAFALLVTEKVVFPFL
jgi:hypothetical protein